MEVFPQDGAVCRGVASRSSVSASSRDDAASRLLSRCTSSAGIKGLITAKLTVNAWVGYANGSISGLQRSIRSRRNATCGGGVTLGWKPTLLSTGGIGYEHDFVEFAARRLL